MQISSLIPATGRQIQTFEELSNERVQAISTMRSEAQPKWSALTFEQRGAHLINVARVLHKDRSRLAVLATDERAS